MAEGADSTPALSWETAKAASVGASFATAISFLVAGLGWSLPGVGVEVIYSVTVPVWVTLFLAGSRFYLLQ